jgi:branched-chain amino acid transport system ATP-binding protein
MGMQASELRQLSAPALLARIPIVWVEHDMQMVADLADRIYVLDHGDPIAEGPPAEVLANPAVVRAYLGARAT